MSGWKLLYVGLLGLLLVGGGQGEIAPLGADSGGALRYTTGTLSTRIWALIAQGQLAEAEALIVEGTASGLLTREIATRMMERIALLNTRLGQLPASLQRVPNFPSQLKDFTLLEIKQMLERKDFSLATKVQLDMVKKLIQEPDRLMEKMGTVR